MPERSSFAQEMAPEVEIIVSQTLTFPALFGTDTEGNGFHLSSQAIGK
jgi:hypothetical protein